jgi:DNA-binding CsgD family transcriptional regulator
MARPKRPPNLNLTPRQLEITALVAEEMTDEEIAYRLGVHVKTIRSINMTSRRKLNVASRVGMALWYARNYGFPN